ncbi:ATP-binding protein [Geosporobacter ferrireducens]|uniref:histidine kinase n=1 Tax=Geosporobacter ferrireducens TaxID=1424294 RepID=A0A1D8GCG6_9FIRM|nr:sensor histidine kinase [Geosporobacter ferrireducens]AOT68580.1 hypothetical protein Gferi_02600 [Geosporobacter ferrireducens]MTI54049.1 sensor histidine kinase [Geosporobacter ferrireducens]
MKISKKYILFMLSVALFGEFYFYPFASHLRFSAGVIALNLIILVTNDIQEFYIALYSGISVFLLRSTTGFLFSPVSIDHIIQSNLPSVSYYIAYGLLMLGTQFRKYRDNLTAIILLFTIIDSLSNILEAIVRHQEINLNIIKIIILAGLIRSIFSYFMYLLYKKQELFIQAREHQKRYIQLNTLISNIQAEMFYLRKSTIDIERIMSKSYALYQKYKQTDHLKEATLDLAREVHEIKKDYLRVLGGFESFINAFEEDDAMSLANMWIIIRDNTNRYLKENQKNITLYFDFQDNFILKKYYHLFTVLNNLIINAIEACNQEGTIHLSQKSDQDYLYFYVEDNGIGIDEDVIPYIFNPGFTTKYDDQTGKSSTGIGLSHVKNIMDELEGSIHFKSIPNKGTTFTLKIPKKILQG